MEKTKTTYKSFEEARRFVRNLKLKSEIEWDKYNYKILRRGGARPKDIPVNPEQVYKELGWIDYADWLGIEYLEFEIARHFVKKVKFKNLDEWKRRYYLVFPDELKIPFYPDLVYEQKGWQGWDHWFGKEYYNYEIARSIVKNLNFQSREDWGKKYNTEIVDDYLIPFYPDEVYKDKGWLGWNHWLGIETPPYTEMYKDFDSAKKYVKSLGLKDIFEWELYVAGLLKEKIYKPEEIPAHPDVIYKNYGWKGWFDWLGYEIVDFETARKFSRRLKLKSKKTWFNYVYGKIKINLPINYDIPDDPSLYYQNNGWKDWYDWLGVNPKGIWRDFNEARDFARSLNLRGKSDWMDYVRGRKTVSTPLPIDIPKDPSQRYKDKGWLGWTDWVKQAKSK